MTAPLPSPAATPVDDRSTLWGVLGIVFALCCVPLGPVFALLSFTEARRFDRAPTLAYAGLTVTAVVLVVYLYLFETGYLDFSGTVG